MKARLSNARRGERGPCPSSHPEQLVPNRRDTMTAAPATEAGDTAPSTPTGSAPRAHSGLQAPSGGRIRPEGEGGFSASWFPVALSSEVLQGAVVGKDFLHGRVVVYRGPDGVPLVRSAY